MRDLLAIVVIAAVVLLSVPWLVVYAKWRDRRMTRPALDWVKDL